MTAKIMRLGTFQKRKEPKKAPLKTDSSMNGMDPVSAGNVLGISRQAVWKAIEAGNLDAFKIVSEEDPSKVLFTVVTHESIERYQFVRRHRRVGGT